MGIGTVISSILAVVLSLGIVLALAWGTIYLLRQWQDRTGAGSAAGGPDRSLRFVRALPLGPRERLVMIETDGELMLLGVTAGGVTVLTRWDSEGERIAPDLGASDPGAPDFPTTDAPRVPPAMLTGAKAPTWR